MQTYFFLELDFLFFIDAKGLKENMALNLFSND